MDYKILTDGCCDLTADIVEKYDIEVIPFYISFENDKYFLENVDISLDQIYERMVKFPDVYPKTSLPSIQNYIEYFEPYVKEGIPFMYLAFNSIMSGAYNCACNARDILLEEYPDARFAVVDTLAVTVTQGLIVMEAARMRAEGVSFEDALSAVEEIKKTNRIFYTVGDVEYLKHGGRIGKLAGIAATTLSLKPLITVDKGEILPSGIGRSRKKTLDKTLMILDEYFDQNGQEMDDYLFSVGYGYDLDEARAYYEKACEHIAGRSHVRKEEVGFFRIGPAVSIHNGPYALGIGCVKKYDVAL